MWQNLSFFTQSMHTRSCHRSSLRLSAVSQTQHRDSRRNVWLHFGQWTEISPSHAYDLMGWMCLSIASYLMAIGVGVWIGRVSTYFGPWLDKVVDHLISKFRQRSGTGLTPPDTANVQDAEITYTRSPSPTPVAMPKARPGPPRTMPPRPISTPTLYEDSSHRYHWDSSCCHLHQARPATPLEPCTLCTDATTFLKENALYRTVKGEKYHKRNCSHVRFKLPGSAVQAPTARAMVPCSCVAEMLEECLRSGSWNTV